ncbi:MAG TPA: ATP-binding protein [Isosphaeraceae bacterium]|jgi:signal transduction histidine kinase
MRVPLKVQMGVVVALFVASLGTLWATSASVVARERRRITAGDVLARAGVALGDRGETLLATALRDFDELERSEWDVLDRRLGEQSAAALRPFDGVEGGYFIRDHRRFLGASFPTEPARPEGKVARDRSGPHGPPPREADLLEIQADAAIRLNRDLLVVEVVPPSTVAIRTAPVVVGGRAVAATWTMTRLVDPLFLDRSLQGYRLSAGLALSGIALALGLTLGLSRTVRRQAAERDRLQVELRRSERLAALGNLLAGVAHEVRNPLAGIRSTVQLWQRGIGPDSESFDDVFAEVERLDAIVGRLLHFSRADAQDLAPGDLNAVVAESARLARGPAESQGVRIDLELDPTLPPVAMAPPALVQVFRNLTTNALHAMPRGGALRMVTRLDPTRRLAEVSVADTGPGLDLDTLAHVFEPFYTTKAGGTGLGLAIAREIALAHRGDLRAANRADGGGAVFTLTLPAGGNGEAR